jgi:hypothetical protein
MRAALMLDMAAADAVGAPVSQAPGEFVEELVVIASTTSTGLLADAGVPTTEVDMACLLPVQAVLMLDMADAVDAASSRAPGAFVKVLVVIASMTSTGLLADASVPTTEVDMVGLLPARAALMLDTAAADAVNAGFLLGPWGIHRRAGRYREHDVHWTAGRRWRPHHRSRHGGPFSPRGRR